MRKTLCARTIRIAQGLFKPVHQQMLWITGDSVSAAFLKVWQEKKRKKDLSSRWTFC
jgi:hypothetical protein